MSEVPEPDIQIKIGGFKELLLVNDALRTRADLHKQEADKALMSPGKDPREVREVVESAIKSIEDLIPMLQPIAAGIVEYSLKMETDRLRDDLQRIEGGEPSEPASD